MEYDDEPCKKLLATNGMINQTSCVKTPQQNARVEGKHRHMLEIARAMRFHASLPLKYLGDCVMSVAHVINRLPTPILNNKPPYKYLHNKPPNHNHLRVLGCLANFC